MKTLQMIVINEDNSMFIIGFNDKSSELLFRVSLNPGHLQKEKIVIDSGFAYTSLYHFDIKYLQKFIHENA